VPEDDQVMAADNTLREFGKVALCSIWGMWVDRHTDPQRDIHM